MAKYMQTNIKSLIKNFSKEYSLPTEKSVEYQDFYDTLSNIYFSNATDQELFNSLQKLLTPFPRKITQNASVARSDERVNFISKMLTDLNFTPKNILDIGAGNAEITVALKNFYKLPKDRVFAIDQKLSNNSDITPLLYDQNGSIPIDDNSIELIIIYEVLHHVDPDNRINLIKEARRVLSPNGYLIIREHDFDKSDDFLHYINMIHLFWYGVKNESIDPLFPMSHVDLIILFNQCGLRSIKYDTYGHYNPQRLYHEIFHKNFIYEDAPLKFENDRTRLLFQNFVNSLKDTRNIPKFFDKEFKAKYGNVDVNNDLIWGSIIIDICTEVLIKARHINGNNILKYESVEKVI